MNKIIFLFASLLMISCGQPANVDPVNEIQEDTTIFSRMTTFERDDLTRDATLTPLSNQDPDHYIYDWSVDKANFTEQVPRVNFQAIKLDSSKTVNPISYEVTKINRPPLFDADCLQANRPVECSNKKLKSFIQSVVDSFQEEDEFTNDYELVTFVINENGEILGDIFIAPQEKTCRVCTKVAAQVVTKMQDWVPAIRNEKPVSVRIQVPVRFR